ncbi:MAG: hypothetical protein ACOC96_08220 [Actinomycetota bacterium]
MSGAERERREAVRQEAALRARRRAQRQLARRAASIRAAVALRTAATVNKRGRRSS